MTKYSVEIEESGGSGDVQTIEVEANSEEEARQQARGEVRGVVKSVTAEPNEEDTFAAGSDEPSEPQPAHSGQAGELQNAEGSDPFGARTVGGPDDGSA